jgi:hypothetical protein
MKNIKLINPENAIHILNEKGLTTGSDQITVFNEGYDLLILNNKEFSQYTQGEYLKVGFGGGGIVGVRYGYITIPLNEYSVDIEIELMQLNYGIALKINDEVIYYKISYLTFAEVINFSKLKAIDLSGWLELESLEPLKKLKNIESIKLTIGSEEGNYENRFDFTSFAFGFPSFNL